MKQISRAAAVFLVALMVCTNLAANADAPSQTVVKVGFPIQPGTSYLNEHGDYAGYLVDYLHQLDLFTNWDIEFVQVDGDLDTQLERLMTMLLSGEIDMLGTMNRTEQLEEFFLYPSYSYGTKYTTLAVLKDNPHWIEEDFSNWDGIRVATYPGYQEQTEAFVYYAMVNDFTYELISCDSYEAMIAAVQTGQADAMVQSDISLTDGFRIVGRFSPTPYYFALSPDNTELQQQLNAAMRSLNSSQPNLQTELYDLHFRYTNGFHISQEHQEYIQSLGTLKVLFIDGDTPYQYIRDGKLTGYAAEYLERFAEMTGLQYEAVIAHTYREALPMVERGEVDLVACIPTNSTLSSLDHVRFTAPYFNSFSVSVCSNPNPHKHPADLEFRINTELALSDVQDREEYGIRADYYALSYYLRKGDVYNRVVVDWANTKNFSYAMGVTSSVPQELVTILNQYASSMSSEDRQAMLYRYSGDPVEYTICLLCSRNTPDLPAEQTDGLQSPAGGKSHHAFDHV